MKRLTKIHNAISVMVEDLRNYKKENVKGLESDVCSVDGCEISMDFLLDITIGHLNSAQEKLESFIECGG